MKRRLSCLLVFVISLAVAAVSLAAGFTDDADAIEKAAKSVLKLGAVDENNPDVLVTGSGFVAFNNSILITNYHVIDGATEVYASDDDDNFYELKYVLCADKNFDIAILEFAKPTNLTPFDLYPDDKIKRGSPVIAIGSPYGGYKNTVTKGIVSSQSERSDGRPEIQFTASISHGNSGGVLLNDDGKVIGVPTETFTEGQNINFAVNISVAQAMYKAWNGKKYSFSNHLTKAEMDFSDVYNHIEAAKEEKVESVIPQAENNAESWTCLNCGKENTTKFCLECGAEKPYWICSCGRINSSNKFCGECGTSCADLIKSFDNAISLIEDKDYSGAEEILHQLGMFNSGSFDTAAGNHIEAHSYISKTYYDLGVYLQTNNGTHDAIIDAFARAGDYADAKDQIAGENARYYKAFYDEGIAKLNAGEYDEAIECFIQAGNYSDAANQITAVYYAKGLSLLNQKDYDAAREAFESIGKNKDAQNKILESYYLEAEDKLIEHAYIEAIDLFNKASEYSDSKDRISEIYYTLGLEALETDNYEMAKDYFTQAGNYKDSKNKIKQIEENAKELIYLSAVKAYEDADYNRAFELYSQIPGYRDADKKAIDAKVADIEKQYENMNHDPKTMADNDRIAMDGMLKKLLEYNKNTEAMNLYKKISYTIAEFYTTTSIDSAIQYYQKADDYADAKKQKIGCMVRKLDVLVKMNDIDRFIKYYQNELIPAGYKEDYVLMEPGYIGKAFLHITNLIKPAGIKAKIPEDEDEYEEAYISYIEELEDQLGLTVDGEITMDEFLQVYNAVYPGCESEKAKSLFEKLADLSYLIRLPEDHSVYNNNYTVGVKKAEKEMHLIADGIITLDEYNVIMKQPVEKLDSPKNLKVTVKNDIVTLSWSKVPGAYYYEISTSLGIITSVKKTSLGITDKTTWTEKNIKTGETVYYYVTAKKYTVQSEPASYKAEIPKYYVPISVPELIKNKEKYMGRYVKLDNIQIDSWWVKDPQNNYTNGLDAIKQAIESNEYKIVLLCHSGTNYVEIVIRTPAQWGWKSSSTLYEIITRTKSISITGTVSDNEAAWSNHRNIPSVSIDFIRGNH